ncbi:hypothetical protein ACIRU3_31445 [Streptomyces sp. NPDC101151]|uniref:hypothetical protein n=1 Tax=Streptomyces sp. NPDC101151 TaxID=3366115 RepID=UPI0037F9077D
MEPTPAQLAAGQPKGLTPEACVYLRGDTPDELSTSADAFVSLLASQTPAPSAPLVGGNRGTDAGGGNGPGTIGGGAGLYRERHDIDDDGRRPEQRPTPVDGRNPFAVRTYNLETR